MYEPQHFMELQDNASGFGDPNSWLSGDPTLSPTLGRNQPPTAAANPPGNVDRVLFKDLVEIVPLVQSLIDRKASSSFTRRGSMIYTKTPSRESLSRKMPDLKGKNTSQSIPGRKKTEHGEKEGLDAESFSIISSRGLTDDDREELDLLKGQVADLQSKLLERDESLNSAEALRNEMSSLHTELDSLKLQTSEKDSLIKSTQRHLSDAKITLADKQAALEKIQWEAMTSNNKVEKLQDELNSMQGEISSFMLLFDRLLQNDTTRRAEDCDVAPYNADNLPSIDDDMDDTEMREMEEARKAYVAAVAFAKEKKDENSIAAAAKARLQLQSYVFGKSSIGTL